MGARQTQGGEEPAHTLPHPHVPASYQNEWRTHYLKEWPLTRQRRLAGCQSECSSYEGSGCSNNINPILLPLPQKRSWQPGSLKWFEFLRNFLNILREMQSRCWYSRLQVWAQERERMTFSWVSDASEMTASHNQHLSSSWRASRFLDTLLWEWHSRWVRLAFYLINHGEVTSFHSSHHPHSFTASTHLFYVAQGFQQNFSKKKGIIQGNKWYSSLEFDITMNY